MISVRVIEEPVELAELAPEWDRLFARQPRPTPFLHRNWFSIYRLKMDLEGCRPFILAAEMDGSLVGLAPLTSRRSTRAGQRFWSVAGLENVHSQDYSWLLEPEIEMEAAGAMLDQLYKLFPGGMMLSWGNAYMDRPANQALGQLLADRGGRVYSRVRRHAPVVHLPASPLKFTDTLAAKTRKRLNRNLRLLGQEGELRLEEVSGSELLPGHLKAAWQLETATWKGRLGTAVGLDGDLEAFYNELAPAMAANGMLCFFVLYLDEKLIAFDYNLFAGDTVHILKTSFDPEYAKFSPNRLVVRALIDWAEDKGLKVLSMGGDADEWKMRWTDQTEEVTWLYAFPPGLKGWWLYSTTFGWKEAVKKVPGLTSLKGARDQRRQQAKRQA